MADNEYSAASLGYSEVACVEHSPSAAVPEFGQRPQNDSEVPTIVRGEQPGNVLDEQPAWSKSVSDSSELEEESGTLAGEPGALPGDGHVLAREASAEEVDLPMLAVSGGCTTSGSCAFCALRHVADIGEARDAAEAVREDASAPLV